MPVYFVNFVIKKRREVLWLLFNVRHPDVHQPKRVEKFLLGVQNVELGGAANMEQKEILARAVGISILLGLEV
ncbi:MAG: hypothetical protein E3K37_03575 [Candidatus Kuenenia sp.]|nr:hypothetical protein [Candidatus Kuenenia hertensis]